MRIACPLTREFAYCSTDQFRTVQIAYGRPRHVSVSGPASNRYDLCRLQPPGAGFGYVLSASGEESMTKEAQKDVIRRLRNAEGHTRGVVRMLESGADCVEIVQQLNAIQGSLNKVAQILLYQHLELCIPESTSADDDKSRQQLIVELADMYGLARSK